LKQLFATSALFIAMGFTVYSNAADPDKNTGSGRLTVTANIAAPSCIFTLNNGMSVDLGKIEPSQLNMDRESDSFTHQANFVVECEAKTQVDFSLIDRYRDKLLAGDPKNFLFQSVGKERQFGLVNKAHGEEQLVGSYMLIPQQPTTLDDGHSQKHNVSTKQHGDIGQLFSTISPTDNTPMLMRIGDNERGAPSKHVTLPFTVEARFMPKNEITFGDQIEVAGETTFKMSYL
jgi:hypothetical protein